MNVFLRATMTAAMLAGAAIATPAEAAYIVNIEQVGNDVVMKGSGSLDTSELSILGSGSSSSNDTGAVIQPDQAAIIFGSGTFPVYGFISGPASMGQGTGSGATSFVGSGSLVGVVGYADVLFLPDGYVSGTSLGTSIATFANQTLASIGLDPGQYVYYLGASPTADTFTINVGTPAPEPTSWALMIAGLGAVGALQRRRYRAAPGCVAA